MSAQIDCPICMDCVESTTKNCVTTECGHCFHTNCLMQSVAHNGFGCPYCRTAMAEVPDEEDSDGYSIEDNVSLFDEDSLTSFRMFHQRLNGEEVEAEPEEYSSFSDDDDDDVDQMEDEDELPAEPDVDYVAQKLAERGITFQDLVKHILVVDHIDYNGSLYKEYERRSSEVFGQFRAIITQYHPEPEPRIVEQTFEPEEFIAIRKFEVDYAAQSKLTKVSFIRQVSCC